MLQSGSIFTDQNLWTLENLQSLKKHFVDNPLGGKRSFYDKLQEQIGTAGKPVIQLASEAVWLLYLFVSEKAVGIDKKREHIAEVWQFSGESPPSSDLLQDDPLRGVAHPGTAFLTGIWLELSFLIILMEKWKSLSPNQQAELLEEGNPRAFCSWVTGIEGGDVRAFRHMLLYLCYPEHFERICSRNHKRKIYAAFAEKLEGKSDPYKSDRNPCMLDRAILEIRSVLENEYGTPELDFYVEPLDQQWRPDPRSADEKSGKQMKTDGGPSGPEAQTRFWVEKTIVRGRPDREQGPHRLGAALWSPQKSSDGKDIYVDMRRVSAGDVVLHLTDNEAITGISRAESPADDSFVGLDDTDWAERPAYRIQLQNYTKLDPPLDRNAFFKDPEIAQGLRALLGSGRGLFYNKDLELNQGTYLTEAQPELVELLNRAYKKVTGCALLEPESFDEPLPQATAYSLEDALRDLFMGVDDAERLLAVWNAKKNLILQGPPGVGKTFAARKLAFALMGFEAHERLEFIQFHQSYSFL
jgi:hypothetical protein